MDLINTSLNKNHEKIIKTIESLLILSHLDLSYYGYFNMYINFIENNNIETCGVNVTINGMNFHYSSKFIDKLTQKEVNFVVLHENFHLLFDHPQRSSKPYYDKKLANVAQDMIINHILYENIPHSFIDIPKDEEGRNMAIFVPLEYDGKLIFEELYDWLENKREEWRKKRMDGEISRHTYGPYGKSPINNRKHIDTWSLEHIFENLEETQGEYFDHHLDDEINPEMKKDIIKNITEALESRGLLSNDIEKTLKKLQKKKEDYLKKIKRSITSVIFGENKVKTIFKPNRRQIEGLKGKRKIKYKINVVLDTSGSMCHHFEKILSYIYRNDVIMNLIEIDTEVKLIKSIKNKKDLQRLKIKGLGGTILQPAIDIIAKKYNNYNTLILTDGYCDTLNLSSLKGSVVIISIGNKVPIVGNNNRVKQYLIK